MSLLDCKKMKTKRQKTKKKKLKRNKNKEDFLKIFIYDNWILKVWNNQIISKSCLLMLLIIIITFK